LAVDFFVAENFINVEPLLDPADFHKVEAALRAE
jgi:hypothetical protein